LIFLLLLSGSLFRMPAHADDIVVAVASNFLPAMEEISRDFEEAHNHKVIVVGGSTGKHFAQISAGAPFDAFFAANSAFPARLENDGIAVSGSRFTYALGKLTLWSPDPHLVDSEGTVLAGADFHRLAIANPKLAPYGRAAKQVLSKLGLWDQLQPKIVRGENVGQTFQFVQTGNAELGFAAWSQIQHYVGESRVSYWHPPTSFYDPVEQQAVLIRDNSHTRKLMDFFREPRSLDTIRKHGYLLP
jgi:molybdate transport system substrate-binding protein